MKSIVVGLHYCLLAATASAQLVIPWYSIDGGGASNSGGALTLSGTIGQADAGVLTGGNLRLTGGFWATGAAAPAGVPAATIVGAVTRKPNTSGPNGLCDLALIPGVKSEPRQGGVTELRIAFDVPPGGPGAQPVTIEQRACPAPGIYVPYAGSSTSSAETQGNDLVLTFTPGLENLRTYRVTVNASVTSVARQSVEVRGLVGDVDSSGLVNAVDRALIVGAWTSPAGFTCASDLDNSSRTNAVDRALVVGAWTAPSNCAP